MKQLAIHIQFIPSRKGNTSSGLIIPRNKFIAKELVSDTRLSMVTALVLTPPAHCKYLQKTLLCQYKFIVKVLSLTLVFRYCIFGTYLMELEQLRKVTPATVLQCGRTYKVFVTFIYTGDAQWTIPVEPQQFHTSAFYLRPSPDELRH